MESIDLIEENEKLKEKIKELEGNRDYYRNEVERINYWYNSLHKHLMIAERGEKYSELLIDFLKAHITLEDYDPEELLEDLKAKHFAKDLYFYPKVWEQVFKEFLEIIGTKHPNQKTLP